VANSRFQNRVARNHDFVNQGCIRHRHPISLQAKLGDLAGRDLRTARFKSDVDFWVLLVELRRCIGENMAQTRRVKYDEFLGALASSQQ
jgi:hypothetical protein